MRQNILQSVLIQRILHVETRNEKIVLKSKSKLDKHENRKVTSQEILKFDSDLYKRNTAFWNACTCQINRFKMKLNSQCMITRAKNLSIHFSSNKFWILSFAWNSWFNHVNFREKHFLFKLCHRWFVYTLWCCRVIVDYVLKLVFKLTAMLGPLFRDTIFTMDGNTSTFKLFLVFYFNFIYYYAAIGNFWAFTSNLFWWTILYWI